MSNISYDNTRALLDKWTPLTVGVEETQPTAPVTIMTGEALDLSHVIDNHWEPLAGNPGRPGVKSAVAGGLIADTTTAELRELVIVVSRLHADFRAMNAKTLEAPVDRGLFLLYELKHCLEFLFDDGENDEHDAELGRLTQSHTDTSSHDGLALSLEGFAYYANRFREQLATLPDFDVSYLDESLVVANRLREQSALKMSSEARDQQRQLLTLRNRFITLLAERVASARRAVRFVFRHYPEVARLASSAYERRKRAHRESFATDEVQPQEEVAATA